MLVVTYHTSVCLDGGRISVRIVYFRLVVENSIKFVVSQKIMRIELFFYCLNDSLRIVMKKINKVMTYFSFSILIIIILIILIIFIIYY
jgi:hypothetical protein